MATKSESTRRVPKSKSETGYTHIGKRGNSTRDKILDAAFDYLMAGPPWRQAAMVDIADIAGVSTATVYQYFENMEAFIPEVFRMLKERGVKPTKQLRAIRLLLKMEGTI